MYRALRVLQEVVPLPLVGNIFVFEVKRGWWVEPTVDGIAEGLRQATSLDSTTLRTMCAKGREWVKAEFGWERIAKQFVSMYENVIAHKNVDHAKL